MNSEVDHIVVRSAPGTPETRYEGWWFDAAEFGTRAPSEEIAQKYHMASMEAHRTGRFETRDDGAVAEVVEVRGDPL